jgi:hypothetical protein
MFWTLEPMRNIFIGALIPIVLAASIFFYVKASLPETVWSDEYRQLLQESFSPNGKLKVGVYNYDNGALGYTSVQVSVVGSKESYPVSGNLLQDQIVESIQWKSDTKAEVFIFNGEELKSKLVFWFD